jgi:FkbM family methyltransferase
MDVGANLGQYASFLRELCGWRGPICSFEPVRNTFAALCLAMGDDPAWRGFNTALGSKSGTAVITHFPGGSVFDSLLSLNDEGRRRFEALRHARTETVAVERLDSLIDGAPVAIGWPAGAAIFRGRRLHLKLDTQGYDLEVLRGAEGCLDRIVSLQLELSVDAIYDGMPTFSDTARDVLDLGFQPIGFFPITEDSATPRPIEFDALYVRSA